MDRSTAELPALAKETFEQVQGYAEKNFGARNGPDFPDVARVLIDMDAFTMKAFLTLALQMISSSSILAKMPNTPGTADVPRIRDALRGSVIEHQLLDVFYWGYALGKRTAEIDALNKMAEPK
jgi:hypothetical protein